MSLLSKISPRLWIVALVCAGGFLVWCTLARIQRIEYVSSLAGRANPVDIIAINSPTGYANGQREMILPERNENSFHWIAQTQQMFSQSEWRVRSIDYENAPFGREVNAASPYRWWLGLIAWIDHTISGRPIGLSVERAALVADPALHLLLLVGVVLFVAWRFGGFSALLLAVGLATIFPLAAGFLPGAVDDHGLAIVCALGNILVLMAGMNARRPAGWFALAGGVGGLGLWISVSTQVPLIAGVFFGALLAAWIARGAALGKPPITSAALPWRSWAVGGSATVLVAYLMEYFPAHLGVWRLESIHPLYGLAWLGLGEILTRLSAWIRHEKFPWKARDQFATALAFAAVAMIPVVLWKTGSRGFLVQDLASVRLSGLPGSAVAASFWAWLARDGATPVVWATALPLLGGLLAGWQLLRRATSPTTCLALAVALGPVLVALGFATQQLGWWSVLDAVLLVMMVAATAQTEFVATRVNRWLWSSVVVAFTLVGISQLVPPKAAGSGVTLTASESQELIERHLAHWLVRHTGEQGVVIFAPPHPTATLSYYGGLRGIGTFSLENRDGFGTTLMIAGVKTMEEVQGLINARGIRYLIIPSWDPFFEQFAQRYLAKEFSNRTSFLANELRRWNLPSWLRPVPYHIPADGGYEGQLMLVFEVVEDQGPAVAAARLTEYLIEIEKIAQAVDSADALRRFPGDMGALAARAQVQMATGDATGVAQTLQALLARLSTGADRFLPWDRRVSLAVVLARNDQLDLAHKQTQRCVAELTEQKLRRLSTGSLYQLMVLSHTFGVEVADLKLRALALELLPANLRDNL